MFKLPDGGLKTNIALIVLKSPITNTLLRDTPSGSNEDARKHFAEKMIPIIRETLPEVPMDYAQISSLEKRLKLAFELEKALGIESENPEDARRVWPPKSSGGATRQQDGSGASERNLAGTVAVVSKPDASRPLRGGWALWGGMAAAVAIAAGWLLFRAKRMAQGTDNMKAGEQGTD